MTHNSQYKKVRGRAKTVKPFEFLASLSRLDDENDGNYRRTADKVRPSFFKIFLLFTTFGTVGKEFVVAYVLDAIISIVIFHPMPKRKK
jgi:hypothetical protein